MFRSNHRTQENSLYCCASMTILVIAMTFALLCPPLSAQEANQKGFGSPEEAMKALVETIQAGDAKGLMAILGPGGEDIIDSGDAVQDKTVRERFVKVYQEKIDYVKEKETRVSVIMGNDHWPFPIPIIKKGDGWVFDARTGKEEVLNRRIGRNELAAIEVCLAYVEAQREYAGTDRERDGIIQYARKFWSDPYKRNGLYWEPAEGEPPSPFGPFAARAAEKGYTMGKGEKPSPYYGYYYKILTAQGKNAPGGAYRYLINGHLVAGYALVAWPAEYNVSGVMTFVVNQNGVVYEKNMGPKTEKIAKAMTAYNPDRTWRRAK